DAAAGVGARGADVVLPARAEPRRDRRPAGGAGGHRQVAAVPRPPRPPRPDATRGEIMNRTMPFLDTPPPRISADEMRRLAAAELSLRSRLVHAALLLVAL